MTSNYKIESVANIKNMIGNSVSMCIVKFDSVKSAAITQCRSQLYKHNIKALVCKNTLLLRALNDSDFSDLNSHVKNASNICMFISKQDDVLEKIKIISEILANIPLLEVRAMKYDGDVYDFGGFTALSKLPSRIESLLNLYMALNTPMVHLMNVLQLLYTTKTNTNTTQDISHE